LTSRKKGLAISLRRESQLHNSPHKQAMQQESKTPLFHFQQHSVILNGRISQKKANAFCLYSGKRVVAFCVSGVCGVCFFRGKGRTFGGSALSSASTITPSLTPPLALKYACVHIPGSERSDKIWHECAHTPQNVVTRQDTQKVHRHGSERSDRQGTKKTKAGEEQTLCVRALKGWGTQKKKNRNFEGCTSTAGDWERAKELECAKQGGDASGLLRINQ
jgi:hypothetical protein